LSYCVGVRSSTTVWTRGSAPLPPAVKRTQGRGRPATRLRRDPSHPPLSVKDVAVSLPSQAWRTMSWREGTNRTLRSRFAALRVRAAHRDYKRHREREEEWLLIEWPKSEGEPLKYWMASLAPNIPVKRLVDTAKMRWRIERDYQELKQEFGLGHYEGRGWRGFHHHATLCIAAYGFLVAPRLTSGGAKKNLARPKASALPEDYTPRGGPQDTASHTRFHRHAAISHRPGDHPSSRALPLLRDAYGPP
jgi:SRSO17 transposase